MGGRLRGWGGVTAMGAACTLTLAAAVGMPPGGSGTRQAPVRVQAPLVAARYASALSAREAWNAQNAKDTQTARDAQTAKDAPDPSDNCDTSLDPASGSTAGAAVQHILDRGRLVVGVDQNSYRWGFRDPATGQIAGFDIDLVKAIAQDLFGDSSKVQYLTIPTKQRIPLIRSGTVDMVVRTMTINCERTREVAFSTAYFTAGQQILVPRNSPVTGYDSSLRGKKVCAAEGSTGLAKLTGTANGTGPSDAERFGATVLTVPNQLDCLVRLQLGIADAVFTDNALAAGQAAQDPAVHLVGRRVTDEPYGVAMSLQAPDLVRRVNRVLEAYRAGGSRSRWMRSYQQWLARDLPGISGPPEPKYG